ncbi:hypothetical protein ACT4UM_09975 [Bacillus sp. SS-TM]
MKAYETASNKQIPETLKGAVI